VAAQLFIPTYLKKGLDGSPVKPVIPMKTIEPKIIVLNKIAIISEI
jgi:hypothetical protein